MGKTNLEVAESECQDFYSSKGNAWEMAPYDEWECACDHCGLIGLCAGGDESGLYFREEEED